MKLPIWKLAYSQIEPEVSEDLSHLHMRGFQLSQAALTKYYRLVALMTSISFFQLCSVEVQIQGMVPGVVPDEDSSCLAVCTPVADRSQSNLFCFF